MNENNLIDIEYSKKLAHLFPKSEWWWVTYERNPDYKPFEGKYYQFTLENIKDKKKVRTKDNPIICTSEYPAPTTDELLERLPQNMKKLQKGCYELTILKKSYVIEGDYFNVGYSQYLKRDDFLPNPYITDKSLTNALAKMIIYLDKEKLL